MQEAGEWRIQKDDRGRRPTSSLPSHLHIQCKGLRLCCLCCATENRGPFAPVVIMFSASLSWGSAEYNTKRNLFHHLGISGHMFPLVHLPGLLHSAAKRKRAEGAKHAGRKWELLCWLWEQAWEVPVMLGMPQSGWGSWKAGQGSERMRL